MAPGRPFLPGEHRPRAPQPRPGSRCSPRPRRPLRLPQTASCRSATASRCGAAVRESLRPLSVNRPGAQPSARSARGAGPGFPGTRGTLAPVPVCKLAVPGAADDPRPAQPAGGSLSRTPAAKRLLRLPGLFPPREGASSSPLKAGRCAALRGTSAHRQVFVRLRGCPNRTHTPASFQTAEMNFPQSGGLAVQGQGEAMALPGAAGRGPTACVGPSLFLRSQHHAASH